jgi:ABC-2 type transport system permease protein
MNGIRTTLAIAWKDLLVTLGDRGLLAVLFLLPLVFSTLFSLSQQGSLDEATGVTPITLHLFVVNEDDGPYGSQVAAALSSMAVLDVAELPAVSDADARVGQGERIAAIVIPAGFSASIDAYRPVALRVIIDPARQGYAGMVAGLANFAASPVSIQGELLEGTRTFIAESGLLVDAPPAVRAAVEQQTVGAIMTQLAELQANPPIAVATENRATSAGPINLIDSFMPAFAVMFAFFLVGHVGLTFHKERDEGTFRRLLAAPVSRASMVAGPLLAFALVVVLQVAFLFGIGAGVFKLRLGDSLLGLACVSLALGFAVSAFGLLLGTVTRNGRQADTLGTLVAFVVPFTSGIFPMNGVQPSYLSGGILGAIGTWTPHMHAAEGYRLLMQGEATIASVAVQVAWLLGFAVVFFLLARWRLRFT